MISPCKATRSHALGADIVCHKFVMAMPACAALHIDCGRLHLVAPSMPQFRHTVSCAVVCLKQVLLLTAHPLVTEHIIAPLLSRQPWNRQHHIRAVLQLEKMNMDPNFFLTRNVNEGFSGGEKKRNEILQLAVLEPEVAILDEIDSGLDVDAMREVAKAVTGLRSEDKCLMLITHYKRLLEYIAPDVVHVMQGGGIVKTGDMQIVDQVESGGYATLA